MSKSRGRRPPSSFWRQLWDEYAKARADLVGRGFKPVGFETIFEKGADGDYWQVKAIKLLATDAAGSRVVELMKVDPRWYDDPRPLRRAAKPIRRVKG